MSETEPTTETAATDEPNAAAGSVRFGRLVISAKLSVILIYAIIIGFNVVLVIGVILAALHRAGRL